MIHLSAGKILEYQLTRSLGLDIYEEIMTAAPVTDVSQSREFQKKFNTFYRIRRNAEWRKDYYELFELAKKGHYPFDDVISLLYVRTGNIEASFSSKMIATIDPEKPIWDQYVLQNLGLELKGKTPREKIDNAVEIYHRIVNWYAEYMKTEEAHRNIVEFDQWLPSYTWLTDVKKIDYLLWGMR